MSNKSDPRIMISLRLTKSLLERIEKFVKKNTPAIKDRTQAIEVALEKLMKPSE